MLILRHHLHRSTVVSELDLDPGRTERRELDDDDGDDDEKDVADDDDEAKSCCWLEEGDHFSLLFFGGIGLAKARLPGLRMERARASGLQEEKRSHAFWKLDK